MPFGTWLWQAWSLFLAMPDAPLVKVGQIKLTQRQTGTFEQASQAWMHKATTSYETVDDFADTTGKHGTDMSRMSPAFCSFKTEIQPPTPKFRDSTKMLHRQLFWTGWRPTQTRRFPRINASASKDLRLGEAQQSPYTVCERLPTPVINARPREREKDQIWKWTFIKSGLNTVSKNF